MPPLQALNISSTFHQWGRIRNSKVRMRDTQFSSKAYGTHEYKDLSMEGRWAGVVGGRGAGSGGQGAGGWVWRAWREAGAAPSAPSAAPLLLAALCRLCVAPGGQWLVGAGLAACTLAKATGRCAPAALPS
jgi:hypothetical protein